MIIFAAKEEKNPTTISYKRQSPTSRFARIDEPVDGFKRGDKVKLLSGSIGTIEWIGCYYTKKLEDVGDHIVGVKLVSEIIDLN